MRLLDSLTVHSPSGPRTIELYHGDLTNMGPEGAVDVLVVSAYPNNYAPTPGTLIGALYRRGVAVSNLSLSKAIDLRENFSCWMSEEIRSQEPGIQFRRVLCFEPFLRGAPAEVVGDIFQSLMPFVSGDLHVSSVAMPLVATGNQRIPLVDILEPLLEAAVHWLQIGLPLRRLLIVEHSELKAAEMKGAFSVLKKRYLDGPVIDPAPAHHYRYDVFVSYSHVNGAEAMFLVDELRAGKPDIRIFFDQRELNAGAAWQYELYEALDDCHKVVALYSPPYLSSKVCREEYNIALFRHREATRGVLLPVYLYSANLPTYMNLVQFIDCREGSRDRLRAASQEILAHLSA
ncbi:MAG: toll/interleukin-1 receptor domain-containing protein [Anaerolineae bacterium]|nr:toll/interleukin-1 receptor domain-containing protein [Anaerolineae bacterium]